VKKPGEHPTKGHPSMPYYWAEMTRRQKENRMRRGGRWIGMVLMMGAAMNHQSLTAGGSGRELRKGIGNGGVEGSGRTPDSIGISHLSGLQEVASPTAARRRRQAFARPVVGPPQYSPCFECPRLDSYVSIKPSSQLTAIEDTEVLSSKCKEA